MHSKVVSSRGNKCCEFTLLILGGQGHSQTLDLFLSRPGIPGSMIPDGAKSHTEGQYQKKAKEAGIFCKLTDPYSSWQNCSESEIREV
jgi:hypothetical protein